ncbi:MAG: outer membrane protein assembly factor BamB [Oceanospirillaceae bacterium]|nr:outer membrane protein assembly factor BamB [Oceanospirillaceae bacterium]
MIRKALAAASVSLLMSACSVLPGAEEEAQSLASVQKADISVEWRTRIGDGSGKQFTRLTMVVDGDTVFAVDPTGGISALSLADGSVVWQRSLSEKVSAGVTLDGDRLYIATRDGMLHSLNRLDGERVWSSPLTSESVAPAGSDGQQVYVHTVDGRVTAYLAETGEQKWSYEAAMPVLSIRGSGSPTVIDELVITGFANGKVTALDRRLGIPRWEKRLATPEGRSELERLVDVDGTVLVDEQLLYAASYHGKIAAMTPRGETRWEEDGSSYYSPVMGLGNLYLTLDDSRVRAYDMNSGSKVWLQDALEGKNLGALTRYNNFLAVTDTEGYLYLLNQVDGSLAGQRLLRPHALHVSVPNQSEATNWRRMRGKVFGARNPLVATDQGLLAYTNDGTILLLSVTAD